jgi:hypothetical protein
MQSPVGHLQWLPDGASRGASAAASCNATWDDAVRAPLRQGGGGTPHFSEDDSTALPTRGVAPPDLVRTISGRSRRGAQYRCPGQFLLNRFGFRHGERWTAGRPEFKTIAVFVKIIRPRGDAPWQISAKTQLEESCNAGQNYNRVNGAGLSSAPLPPMLGSRDFGRKKLQRVPLVPTGHSESGALKRWDARFGRICLGRTDSMLADPLTSICCSWSSLLREIGPFGRRLPRPGNTGSLRRRGLRLSRVTLSGPDHGGFSIRRHPTGSLPPASATSCFAP